MKHTFALLQLFLVLLISRPGSHLFAQSDVITSPPPPAKTTGFSETICDTTIADPYRYMEDLADPDVQAWLRKQADFARQALSSIGKHGELIDKMEEFDRRKKEKIYNLVISESNRYFYLKQQPGDETGKLYFRDGFKGKEKLLFDPETYGTDSSSRYVVSRFAPSDDGRRIVIGVAADGSENTVLNIMDVETGEFFDETIDRCRFASPSWLADGSGFFYNRTGPAEQFSKQAQMDSRIYLHMIGTSPDADREIFSRELNPSLPMRAEDIPGLYYDKYSGYMYAFVHNVDRRMHVYYAPVEEYVNDRIAWKPLVRPSDNIHDIQVTRDELYLLSADNAPNFRVLKTSLRNPDITYAECVVPEPRDAVLSSFTLTDEALYYTLSRNGVQAEFYRMDPSSKTADRITLPFSAGTIRLSSRGFMFPEVWIVIGGWANDYKRFRYDPAGQRCIEETLSSSADYPEYGDLVVEELMVPSHDGVMVPLSLVYDRRLKRDGRNPVLFYGYGAYGKPVTPFFSPGFLLWTHYGGILAVAHVRGGGELGDSWHKAGMKTTKPNTWLDLISLAEYTIEKKYTSRGMLAVNSASAGGIFAGRAMTQRPDLFAAVIAQVGAMNPLRGEETPNGPVNAPEFGTVEDPAECRALIRMDPYLHIRQGVDYPATLVTAGINDPRVIAWQPAKFAARLQAATSSDRPVLLFTDYEAGHGIGNARSKQFESLADVLGFAFWQTGHPDFRLE
ncbi:MAG: S9 family peptidase [Prosthecochloris sp.]|nr:S9 family peptidase [Prosthecochloris sp.]